MRFLEVSRLRRKQTCPHRRTPITAYLRQPATVPQQLETSNDNMHENKDCKDQRQYFGQFYFAQFRKRVVRLKTFPI
jgi:hypothetical protein